LAAQSGARVAQLRIGIVLGSDGGALAAMLPAFRLGLGGPLGNGEQYLPWIHLDDLVAIIVRGLQDERFTGRFNACAPNPVRGREFATELGRALGRPARLTVPALALRLVLGARAEVTLQSQRALPQALQRLGYHFQHAQLSAALAAILSAATSVELRRARSEERRDLPLRPSYVLEQRSRLRVPLTEAFAFFCNAQNLGLITPSWMRFAMTSEPPSPMAEGSELHYRIELGPVPVRWKTVIHKWSPPHGFVDLQASGPYALWCHEHHLAAAGDETEMLDRVYYSPPLGVLGRLVHPFLIGPMLRSIFAYRADATQRLFGQARTPPQLP
jgi:ligand-binding SRPBCC domain-containing protein